MDKLQIGRDYLKYRFKAMTAHDIHSPFVFEFLNDVISDQVPYYGYELIESLRCAHLLDNSEITVHDFGSRKGERKEKISTIARNSLLPKKYSQLLFRIANSFGARNILELGTSLGISTLYLSMPHANSRVITLEGSDEIASLARKNFDRLKRKNIEILRGDFESTLQTAIEKLPGLDLVFIDGNHRKVPTLQYFGKCLGHAHENSVFIFDDIHWSREMNDAWKTICLHPSVSVSIDLFQLGIIFFRKGIPKQDFILKF